MWKPPGIPELAASNFRKLHYTIRLIQRDLKRKFVKNKIHYIMPYSTKTENYPKKLDKSLKRQKVMNIVGALIYFVSYGVPYLISARSAINLLLTAINLLLSFFLLSSVP